VKDASIDGQAEVDSQRHHSEVLAVGAKLTPISVPEGQIKAVETDIGSRQEFKASEIADIADAADVCGPEPPTVGHCE
jgi:hypothetical protein